MRRAASILFASFVIASPAMSAAVGNFSVQIVKDPFGGADRYIASTEQNNAALFIRCLSGKVGLAFGVYDEQPKGAQAVVKLRVDDGPVVQTTGDVVATQINQIWVQTGDLAFVEMLAKANTLAVRIEFGTIGAFYTFKLRSANKVVAGVKKACRVQQKPN